MNLINTACTASMYVILADNLISAAYTASMSDILSEDVRTSEMRNPKLSGMSRNRKSMFARFFQNQTARKYCAVPAKQ